MLNGLVLQNIKDNAKQLTDTGSNNTNENVNNKGSGITITITEKIIQDTMKENFNKSREEVIKEFQDYVNITVPENNIKCNKQYNSNNLW